MGWFNLELTKPPIPAGASFSNFVWVRVRWAGKQWHGEGSMHRDGWWFLCNLPPSYHGPSSTDETRMPAVVLAWKEKCGQSLQVGKIPYI